MDPAELIRRRRAQMLVHSYIYYWMHSSIIDDHTFDRWGRELADLQEKHPEPIGFYDETFSDWNGDTGMHLPRDEWINAKAQFLLRVHESRETRMAGD